MRLKHIGMDQRMKFYTKKLCILKKFQKEEEIFNDIILTMITDENLQQREFGVSLENTGSIHIFVGTPSEIDMNCSEATLLKYHNHPMVTQYTDDYVAVFTFSHSDIILSMKYFTLYEYLYLNKTRQLWKIDYLKISSEFHQTWDDGSMM